MLKKIIVVLLLALFAGGFYLSRSGGGKGEVPTASAQGSLDVPLEVKDYTGFERVGDPVTSGVPIPKSVNIKSIEDFRIEDSNGNTVPAQFKVLTRWACGPQDTNCPIKWLLVDFQVNVSANGTATYHLTDEGGVNAAATNLSVSDQSEKYTINTGTAKFEVSKNGFKLFDNAWVDLNNDKIFSDSEKVLVSDSNSGFYATARDWSDSSIGANYHAGEKYYASQGYLSSSIEEIGPLRTVIKVNGKHLAPTGGDPKGLYEYTARLFFYAGKSDVRVDYRIESAPESGMNIDDTQDNYYVPSFEELGLNLKPNMAGSANYILGGDTYFSGTTGNNVLLYQDSSGGDHWKDTSHQLPSHFVHPTGGGVLNDATGAVVPGVTFRGYKVYNNGSETSAGNKASGALDISNGNFGVTVAVEDFWQNFPKGIKINSDNSINLKLLPEEFSLPYFFELGQQKTHKIFLNFHKSNVSENDISKFSKTRDRRLMALTPSDWYSTTDAFDWGFGAPDSIYRGKDSLPYGKDVLDGIDVGWNSYGWITNFNDAGGHWNQYNTIFRYLISGDIDEYEFFESKALWTNDLAPLHWKNHGGDGPPEFYTSNGLNPFGARIWLYNENIVHKSPDHYEVMFNNLDTGHIPQFQLLEHYLFTGEEASRQSMIDLAQGARGAMYCQVGDFYNLVLGDTEVQRCGNNFEYPIADLSRLESNLNNPNWLLITRYEGFPIFPIAQVYELTGNETYRKEARLFMHGVRNAVMRSPIGQPANITDPSVVGTNDMGNVTSHAQAVEGFANPNFSDATSSHKWFMIGNIMSGVIKYFEISGDEEARDTVAFLGECMGRLAPKYPADKYWPWSYAWGDYASGGNPWPHESGWPFHYTANILAWAYHHSHFDYMRTILKDLSEGNAYNGLDKANIFTMAWQELKFPSSDTIDPAATTDFSVAAGSTPGSVNLSWTAAGDDGTSGTAKEYQIKYSKGAEIVEWVNDWPDMDQNPQPQYVEDWHAYAQETLSRHKAFWAADNVKNEPTPKSAGTKEQFTIANLESGVYYFAIRTWDDLENVSGMSNVVRINVSNYFGIETPVMADAKISTPYSFTLSATGGQSPYTWSVISGSLPNGLTLNSTTGDISGTPTTLGNDYTFTIKATDSSQNSTSKSFTLSVVSDYFAIVTSSLPLAQVGTAYSQTLSATGGQLPYNWSVISGSLPNGLTLNSATGEISGMPTILGDYTFEIKAVDSSVLPDTLLPNSFSNVFRLRVDSDSFGIMTTSLPDAKVGMAYSRTLSTANGTYPYTWSVISGSLPDGLTLDSARGIISGTPTTPSDYTFEIKVVDSSSTLNSFSRSFTLNVASSATSGDFRVSTSSLPDAQVGTVYSRTLSTVNGISPYTWSVISGSLPPGLALTSGTIAGTPSEAGTYNFTIEAKDSSSPQKTAPKSLSLTVTPSPVPVKKYTIADFLNLKIDWLQTKTSPVDVNSDGTVNSKDLGIMMNGWDK